jgi:NADH dehydrogenase
MKHALVLGGSGFVGKHVCKLLIENQYQVTVPSRLASDSMRSSISKAKWVAANVLKEDNLRALVQGQDLVINLVAILHGSRAEFDEIHRQLPEKLARVCVEQRVAHLIHVSALGADPRGSSQYQRSKGSGEQSLLACAENQQLPITILRPSVIFGIDDQFINMFARIQKFAPVMPLASSHTRFQPVWVDDVAKAILNLAQTGAGVDRIFEICGPEVMTLAQLVQHAGRWAQCERKIIPLPAAIARMQALLMECLPGKPLMSRDNLDSMMLDNVASLQFPGLEKLNIRSSRLQDIFKIQS